MKNYPGENDGKLFDEELDQLVESLQKKDPHAAVVFLVSKDGVTSSANCKGNLLTQLSMVKSTLNSLMKEFMKDSPLSGDDSEMARMFMQMLMRKFKDASGSNDEDGGNKGH